MIELMLALVIVSLLAALALPLARFGTGPGLQRYESRRVAALLQADRNEALRSGRDVVTRIDLSGRRIVSGAAKGVVILSQAVSLSSRPPALDRVRFAPDGHSSGGDIVVAVGGRGVAVRVSAPTAAIRIEDF